MSHEIVAGDVVPPVILTILTGTLFILFFRKRRQTGVNALDWLIGVFGGVALMGTLQLLLVFYQHDFALFKYVPFIKHSPDVFIVPRNPIGFHVNLGLRK